MLLYDIVIFDLVLLFVLYCVIYMGFGLNYTAQSIAKIIAIYRDISIYYILYILLYIGGCDCFGSCDLVLCTYVAHKLRKNFMGYGVL